MIEHQFTAMPITIIARVLKTKSNLCGGTLLARIKRRAANTDRGQGGGGRKNHTAIFCYHLIRPRKGFRKARVVHH